MKWHRIRRIFDPTQHRLPNHCKEFAQAPQTLIFDDFVRIYFSTREFDDKHGKYLSHIAFIDMDKTFDNVLRVSQKPVIPLGGLGCFDEHGIFPMSVLRHGDKIFGYTCGWSRRFSVSVETSIGLAISHDDGESFVRAGEGPILTASLHEPFLVGDGFVRVINDIFHMWYIFGTDWKKYSGTEQRERIYKIGHAVSTDGIKWVKDDGRRLVTDVLGEDESQALPTVIAIDGTYHMFFCYRHSVDFRASSTRSYRIGHALSSDLINWIRNDNQIELVPSPGEWDSEMQCYPHVFECDGNIYLLYNGNEFGRFGFGIARLEQ